MPNIDVPYKIVKILNLNERYYLFSFKKEKTYLYKAITIPPPHGGYNWDEFSEIDLYIKPDGTKEFYINLIERLLKMKTTLYPGLFWKYFYGKSNC
jgi:hypothetical protein